MFWPTFVIAILSAIIASQAMLSGAFAILSKALSLGCFPSVQVIHTSNSYEGQVYIPEVNFLMGLASIIVTITFRTTTEIGNAYGKQLEDENFDFVTQERIDHIFLLFDFWR